ncbi:MAG: hypothetical protein AAB974_01670 [Patescibacteria group bacterium]
MDQKNQIDRILAVVEEISLRLGEVEGRLGRVEGNVAAIAADLTANSEQVAGLLEWRTDKDQHDERVLGLLLDTRDRVERLESGFSEVKEWKAETLNKLDGFLVVVNRHESEIAALRGGQQRVEERLGKG